MDYQIIVAGHLCVDLTPEFDRERIKSPQETFVPGKLVNVGKLTISTGGPVSNTGIALKKLGIPTQLMGKVGDDELGQLVMSLLEKEKAADCMTVSKGSQTSYTNVIVLPGYDRIFLHNPGANSTFRADDIDYEAVGRAKLFHVGYPPLMKGLYENNGRELIEIFRRVKALGVTTSLDMSLPDAASESGRVDWEGILKNLLPYVDFYLPSAEETMYMINRKAYERLNEASGGKDLLQELDLDELPPLGEKLLEYGAGVVAVKCGEKGFYIATASKERLQKMGAAAPMDLSGWADRELHEESFHVEKIASATGSGDSSIAGFLAAYFRKCPIEECIRMACCLGGQNVQVMDALSGIHGWQESADMIQGWEKNTLDYKGQYWQRSEEKGLLVGKSDKA